MAYIKVFKTVFKPIWPEKLLKKRLKSGKAILTPLGLEKHCSRCNTYWPADNEFFYKESYKRDGLSDWCKACYQEWRIGLEPAKLANK